MGLNFRKSIKIGPARVNLSKSGIGYSVGTKGLRFTKKAGGGTRTTASIPGTGISYTKNSGNKKKNSSSSAKKSTIKTVSTPATVSAPHKKSWFTAIISAIIAFGMAGGGSLIALAIVIGIISAFVYIPAGLF